jgi:DNA-binding response OmpR family regulator
MPETLEDFLMTRPPTAERPLLGQTLLVVEDSRFACEALRLICQRSGARIRRADSLKSASRHLCTYRPGIVLVDVGLPDGSGLDLVRTLANCDPRIPLIMAMSGDDSLADKARDAGADAFLEKPITSISAFQSAILSNLPMAARPTGLRAVCTDEVSPDRIALRDDLALAADLLVPEPDQRTLDYLTNFLLGIAKSLQDHELRDAVHNADASKGSGQPSPATIDHLRKLVLKRLKDEQHV